MAQTLSEGWAEPEAANDTEPRQRRERTEEEKQKSRRRGGERGRLTRWGLRSLPPIEEDL